MLFSRDLSRLGNVHLASSDPSSFSSAAVFNSEYAFRAPSQHSSLRRFRRSGLGTRPGGGGGAAEHNMAALLRGRETEASSLAAAFARQCHVTSGMVKRLGLKKELYGHNGCVNCLEWNYEGNLLASGSDDLSVIIWDPLKCRKLVKIRTGHGGNIFSVKFMPESNDSIVVTGAADYRIRVHDLNALAASENDFALSAFLRRDGGRGRPSELYRAYATPPTQVFSCHAGRVKRLATAPGLPFTFWSGAEDGLVMEFDLRTPDLAQATNPKNVLINLNHHLGLNAEVKCLAVNPLRPHLIAVGANDPYVRVFDRRMLTCTSVKFPNGSSTNQGGGGASSSSRFTNAPWDQRHALLTHLLSEEGDLLTPESAQYFVAGHLPIKQEDYRRRYRTLASTYLTFSPDGSELLANLGGEQLYLFDLQECDKPKRLDVGLFADIANSTQGSSSSSGSDTAPTSKDAEEDNSDSGKSEYETYVKHVRLSEDAGIATNDSPPTPTSGTPPPPLLRSPNASLIESLKEKGNQAFNRQHYCSAIALYNEALAVEPGPLIYANRAAALMKRGWDGDLYAALRDCHEALKGETLPSIKCKAHFRLAKCLYELQWTDEALICIERFKVAFPDHAAKPPCETLSRDIKATLFGFKERESKDKDEEDDDDDDDSSSAGGGGGGGNSGSRPTARRRPPRRPGRPRSPVSSGYRLSEKESSWRSEAKDYKLRFAGHCNTTTDIKEANFFGSNGQFIVAGSDDGSFFIWDRNTTNIARVLRGDDSIVNCLQSHPACCLLASSGIDPVVRLWSPRPDDGIKDEREVSDSDNAAFANQRRMNADPLEVMLMNMGYRVRGSGGATAGEEEDEDEDEADEADIDDDVARPIVCPTS